MWGRRIAPKLYLQDRQAFKVNELSIGLAMQEAPELVSESTEVLYALTIR